MAAEATFATSAFSTADAASYTFASRSIGTASSGRLVVVAIHSRKASSSSAVINSVTVGGEPATVVINHANTFGGNITITALAVVIISSGTTADVVVTFNGTMLRCGIGIWAVAGAAPSPESVYSTSGSGVDNNIAVDADRCVISAVSESFAAARFVWTDLAERYDSASETFDVSGADANFASSDSSVNLRVNHFSGVYIRSQVAAVFEPALPASTQRARCRMNIAVGSIDQSLTVLVVNNAGKAATGLTHTTLPTIKWRGTKTAASTITLSALASATAAHSDGGVFEIAEGRYRLDLPDAIYSITDIIEIWGEDADHQIICEPIQVGNVPISLGTNAPANWLNTAAFADGAITNAKAPLHVVAGTSQIVTPADLDIRLAPGDAAKVILGQPILIGDSYRIPTAKGSGPSVDEIALDDATGLTPNTTAYAYRQPWESGRPSTAGMTDLEIAALSALNTHGTATAGGVTAVSNKIGTPTAASVSADIAAVKASADAAASNASTAASNASSAASSASTAASNASTAASNASTAATNAGNAASTASAINTKLGTPVGVSVSADIAAAKASADTAASNASTAASNASTAASNASTAATNVATLLGKFTGITLLAKWLRLMAGKTADAPTLAEFQADAATTFNNVTDSLESNRDAIAGISGGGGGPVGAYAQTFTVTRSDNSAPVSNARVRVTDGIVSWVGVTNVSGVAVIGIDAGTYTVTIAANGATFTPTALSVIAEAAVAYSVTPIVIGAPADPNMTNVRLDINRNVHVGPVTFTLQILSVPTSAAGYWSLIAFDVTVPAEEDQLLVELYTDATYRIKSGAGQWVTFTPTGSVFDLQNVLGE